MLAVSRARFDPRPAPSARGVLLVLRDLVAHVGFQQLVVFRAATALHRIGLTPLAMVLCRLLRYVYGAEMHWATDVAPGVLLVHGNGLVVSRDARVGSGCVLFHNVTIGRSRSADGEDGSPVLLDDVHVGPGAAILGPVTVGPRSKIGPNAVVASSVPATTSVLAPEPELTPRSAADNAPDA